MPLNSRIQLPRIYLWGGVLCTAVFSLLLGIFVYSSEMIALVAAVFTFFLLMGICLLVMYSNWRIDYDSNGFAFTNGIGKTRTYRYEDILSIERAAKVILHISNRRIAMVHTSVGLQRFLTLAEAGMRVYNEDNVHHQEGGEQ